MPVRHRIVEEPWEPSAEDHARMAALGFTIGRGVSYRAAPPPWWRPLARRRWHIRQAVMRKLMMRVVAVTKTEIVLDR